MFKSAFATTKVNDYFSIWFLALYHHFTL